MTQQHHVLRLNHLVFLGIKILNYEDKLVSIKDWTNSIQKDYLYKVSKNNKKMSKNALKYFKSLKCIQIAERGVEWWLPGAGGAEEKEMVHVELPVGV